MLRVPLGRISPAKFGTYITGEASSTRLAFTTYAEAATAHPTSCRRRCGPSCTAGGHIVTKPPRRGSAPSLSPDTRAVRADEALRQERFKEAVELYKELVKQD